MASAESGPQPASDQVANAWLLLTALLFVAAGICWLLAFTSSLGAASPILVLGMPAEAVAGDRLPLRVIAIDEGSKTQKTGAFRADIVAPSSAAPLSSQRLDELPTDIPLPAHLGRVDVVVTGPLDDEAPAQVRAPLTLVERLPAQATFTFRSWTQSVLTTGGPPLYPLDGDVLASQPSTVLMVQPPDHAPPLVVEEVKGNAAQTLDSSGRALRLERRDIRLEAPLSAPAGSTLSVRTTPAAPFELDLLVDGVARRSTVIRGEAQVTVPSDARPGAPFVVHVSRRPFPQGKGVFHVGRVGDGGLEQTVPWALDQVRAAGATDDPLVALLASGALSEANQALAARALLRRLVPDQLRAARAGASSDEQRVATVDARRAGVDRWRLPFRLLALLFALAALVGTLRSRPKVAPAEASVDEGAPALNPDDIDALTDKPRTRLWGAFGLVVALSLLGLLDWTLG